MTGVGAGETPALPWQASRLHKPEFQNSKVELGKEIFSYCSPALLLLSVTGINLNAVALGNYSRDSSGFDR